MKRLLFISNLFPDSNEPVRGLDNAVLLRHLARHTEIRVISPRPSFRADRVRNLNSAEEDEALLQPIYVPTPYIPKFGSHWNARLMRRALRTSIEKLVTDWHPDAVLTSWLFPDGCAVAPLACQYGLPHVMITQGSDTHVYLSDRVRRQQIVAAIKASSAVICRSSDLGNRLAAAGANPEKLHTIYNGVDGTLFRPQDRDSARKQISPPPAPESLVLVFVGNFLPVKNPLFLLRAHASVCREFDEPVALYLIGSGPLENQMHAEVDRLDTADQVHFTGPLPSERVATHIAAADALCLTSHNEGLPNVILEALACNTPVVTTDVGGISEVIDRASRGLLVPSLDPEAYCAALKKTIANSNERTAAAGLGDGFSWETVAGKYQTVLESATENFRR